MTAAAERLRVEVVVTIAQIDPLAEEWNALEARTPEATGFQSFAWCRAWLAAAADRGAPCRPRIVTVREDERLVMLWPLAIERKFKAAIARWIGEPMTQYGDILAEAGEGRRKWREAAEAELSQWRDVDLFAFTRVRADGVLARTDGSSQETFDPQSAPFVDLSGLANGSARRRRHKSLERRAKRLAAAGPVRLEAGADGARRAQLVETALALKKAWLARKGFVSAGLFNSSTQDFLEMLALSGYLRAYCLLVGEEIAAIELGFVSGASYRSLLLCYDERFAAGSPGQALTSLLLEHCAKEGLGVYDFLAPADSHKLVWASDAVDVETRFVAVTLRGRVAAFALARLRPLAKRLQNGIPENYRTTLWAWLGNSPSCRAHTIVREREPESFS